MLGRFFLTAAVLSTIAAVLSAVSVTWNSLDAQGLFAMAATFAATMAATVCVQGRVIAVRRSA